MSESMDTKLRELTYRLMAMSPEAPPFPEEEMVQLKPTPASAPPTRRRSPIVWVAAAAVAALLLVGVPLVLLRGGPATNPSTTVPPATQTTETPATTTTANQITEAPVTTTTAAPSTTTTTGPAPAFVNLEGVVDGMTVVDPAVNLGFAVSGAEHASVDGTEVEMFQAGIVDGVQTYYANADVELTEGPNTIEVVLAGPGGTTTETINVTYAPNAERQIAYLTKVGPNEIVADYIQWLTGDAANQAAFEDGVIGSVDEGVPNDYYIRNTNPQLRTLPLGDNPLVILQTSAMGSVTGVAVPIDEWLGLFKDDGTPWNYETDTVPDWPAPNYGYVGASTVYAPYWLTLDGDGNVIQIEQQYIP